MFSKRLKWSEVDDFGQTEAKENPYTYVAWQNKEYGELRVIRRANDNGIIVPMQDFSIYCRDRDAAKKLAEKLNKALRKSREYNRFQTLF
jgi:hypothetical protein